MSRRRRFTPVALVLPLLFVGLAAGAEELRQEFTESYDIGRGAIVSLRNINGSIQISSWDGSTVQVEATKIVKTMGRERAELAMEELLIEVETTADGLDIRTRHPVSSSGVVNWILGRQVQSKVSFRIRVPADAGVRAQTVNGNVEISSVGGRIEVTTTNGQIRIIEASGAATATTTNGNIRADFHDLTAAGDMSFRTMNGGITVSLPSDLGWRVDASTVNGAVSSDFTLTSGQPSSSGKRLRGEINGGGDELNLRTVNGSIQLRRGRG